MDGATAFGTFFALTYSVPGWVEGLAARFIESELFVLGASLAVAAVVCAYFYVFEQNWLLTIVYAA